MEVQASSGEVVEDPEVEEEDPVSPFISELSFAVSSEPDVELLVGPEVVELLVGPEVVEPEAGLDEPDVEELELELELEVVEQTGTVTSHRHSEV